MKEMKEKQSRGRKVDRDRRDDPDVARTIEQVLEISASAPSGAATPANCCAACARARPTCASSISACRTWTGWK